VSVSNPNRRGPQRGSRFTIAVHLLLQAEKFKLSGDGAFPEGLSRRQNSGRRFLAKKTALDELASGKSSGKML
jgi:hypothetical protein